MGNVKPAQANNNQPGWGSQVKRDQLRLDVKILVIILALASLIGIFWVGLIAAWDHHDEPSHFQYVRRLVDNGQVPVPGEENWKLNRQILKSMIWNGFFERMNLDPILPAPKEPVFFPGYSQYGEPPAYYYAASVAVRLLLGENITRQMFGARLISLFFFLLTVLAAWGIARELVPFGHPLRWMLPISVTLFPTLIDVMTAVNNDAASITVVSFFLWICVRLIKHGMRLPDLLLGVGLSIIAWFTKSTAALVIPLFPLALLFSIFRGKTRSLAWLTLILILVPGTFLLFQRGDAAYFYRSVAMTEATRTRHPQAVHEEWVLQVNESKNTTPIWMPALFQPVPFVKTVSNIGQEVTLGFWMWADRPVEARSPGLATEKGTQYQFIQLNQTPTFYTINTVIDEKARVWLNIDPFQDNQDTTVFLDGLVLALGDRPLDSPPIFSDSTATLGTWGGKPFENMLRNGSAEESALRVRSVIDDLIARFYPDQIRPSFILMSAIDKDGTGWYYNLVFKNIFATLVGYFGWDHIRLDPPALILLLEILLFIGIIAGLVGLFVFRKTIDWAIVIFLGVAVGTAFLATVPRGIVFLAFPKIYVPVGRYILPVIIPILIAANLGWFWIWDTSYKLFKKKQPAKEETNQPYSKMAIGVFGSVCLLFNLAAIINIWHYYGGYHLFM